MKTINYRWTHPNPACPPGWSAADLHIHTSHSDGTASVVELLAHAATHTALRVIAITDHDTISGAKNAERIGRDFGIDVIVGEEISTAQGHLLGLFLSQPIPPGQSAQHTIAAIHAQGGLAIAPHPFDDSVPSLGRRAKLAELDLDAIEIFNAGVYPTERSCNRRAHYSAIGLNKPCIASSDAHSLKTVGRALTFFPGRSAQDLRQAIEGNQLAHQRAYWRFADYADIWINSVRLRGVRRCLEWALIGARKAQPAGASISR